MYIKVEPLILIFFCKNEESRSGFVPVPSVMDQDTKLTILVLYWYVEVRYRL
jgi:hypothetical protein